MSRRKASEASTREAQRRNQRGFTLLQMIVTVAIVLIVSGFAAIRIASAR